MYYQNKFHNNFDWFVQVLNIKIICSNFYWRFLTPCIMQWWVGE